MYTKSPRRATGATAPASTEANDEQKVDREIPAVLFNYGQQLLHLGRSEEAATLLQRARKLATDVNLSSDHVAKIEFLLAEISANRDDRSIVDESIERHT